MLSPKGSKNQAKPIENVDEKIAAVEAEIADLQERKKEKKAELRKLNKVKEKADKIAAAKQAEEDRKKLLEAIEKSGKSIDEVMEFLKWTPKTTFAEDLPYNSTIRGSTHFTLTTSAIFGLVQRAAWCNSTSIPSRPNLSTSTAVRPPLSTIWCRKATNCMLAPAKD